MNYNEQTDLQFASVWSASHTHLLCNILTSFYKDHLSGVQELLSDFTADEKLKAADTFAIN